MTFTSKFMAPSAAFLGIAAGLNIALGSYPTGLFMAFCSIVISVIAVKSAWLEGHTTATKVAIEDMKKFLEKLDKLEKKEPPEDWWKKD